MDLQVVKCLPGHGSDTNKPGAQDILFQSDDIQINLQPYITENEDNSNSNLHRSFNNSPSVGSTRSTGQNMIVTALVLERDEESGGWLPAQGGGLSRVGLYERRKPVSPPPAIASPPAHSQPIFIFPPPSSLLPPYVPCRFDMKKLSAADNQLTTTNSCRFIYSSTSITTTTIPDKEECKNVVVVSTSTASTTRTTNLPHHPTTTTTTFKILGTRIADNTSTLDCPIVPDLKYYRANPTFHHWRINQQLGDQSCKDQTHLINPRGPTIKYGLNFQSPMQAVKFDSSLQSLLHVLQEGREQLTHSNTQTPFKAQVDPILEHSESQSLKNLVINPKVKPFASCPIIKPPFLRPEVDVVKKCTTHSKFRFFTQTFNKVTSILVKSSPPQGPCLRIPPSKSEKVDHKFRSNKSDELYVPVASIFPDHHLLHGSPCPSQNTTTPLAGMKSYDSSSSSRRQSRPGSGGTASWTTPNCDSTHSSCSFIGGRSDGASTRTPSFRIPRPGSCRILCKCGLRQPHGSQKTTTDCPSNICYTTTKSPKRNGTNSLSKSFTDSLIAFLLPSHKLRNFLANKQLRPMSSNVSCNLTNVTQNINLTNQRFQRNVEAFTCIPYARCLLYLLNIDRTEKFPERPKNFEFQIEKNKENKDYKMNKKNQSPCYKIEDLYSYNQRRDCMLTHHERPFNGARSGFSDFKRLGLDKLCRTSKTNHRDMQRKDYLLRQPRSFHPCICSCHEDVSDETDTDLEDQDDYENDFPPEEQARLENIYNHNHTKTKPSAIPTNRDNETKLDIQQPPRLLNAQGDVIDATCSSTTASLLPPSISTTATSTTNQSCASTSIHTARVTPNLNTTSTVTSKSAAERRKQSCLRRQRRNHKTSDSRRFVPLKFVARWSILGLASCICPCLCLYPCIQAFRSTYPNTPQRHHPHKKSQKYPKQMIHEGSQGSSFSQYSFNYVKGPP